MAPDAARQAQDDATEVAIRSQERAGLDLLTDGEIRRESYSNHFATALEGLDLDSPGTVLGPLRAPQPGAAHRRPARTGRRPCRCATCEFLRAGPTGR